MAQNALLLGTCKAITAYLRDKMQAENSAVLFSGSFQDPSRFSVWTHGPVTTNTWIRGLTVLSVGSISSIKISFDNNYESQTGSHQLPTFLQDTAAILSTARIPPPHRTPKSDREHRGNAPLSSGFHQRRQKT